MSYLVLGLFFLAIAHFIYESILAPSFRMDQRFQLFALRDELCLLKIDRGQEVDDKHFHYLQDSINALLAFLPRFDAATLAAIERQLKHDPGLKKKVEARSRVLDDCRMPELISIRKRTLVAAAKTFLVNTGGWGIYLLPIAGVMVCLSSLKNRIKPAISLSTPDFQKVIPDGRSVEVAA